MKSTDSDPVLGNALVHTIHGARGMAGYETNELHVRSREKATADWRMPVADPPGTANGRNLHTVVGVASGRGMSARGNSSP